MNLYDNFTKNGEKLSTALSCETLTRASKLRFHFVLILFTVFFVEVVLQLVSRCQTVEQSLSYML